ncbi:MAG: DUF882 domain-containing protein [Clostridia bacterium]|nr:DUF882 domain-containing protein [Clostridia bacterium]
MAVKTYSLRIDGEKLLSKNFKVKEFRCKDGSDKILIDTKLVELLQKIRDFFGKPVTITSGYRNATYNTKIGGANNSQHMYGTAADIKVQGVDPLMVARYAEIVMHDKGGIGYYYSDSNFTHVDVRTSKARWKNGAGSEDVSVKNHGMIYVADIINELYARDIITDRELWQKKLVDDKNAYWLARKAAAFTVNRGRSTTYGDVGDVEDIVKALNQRGIITDTELWKRELPEDINLYWLARKICNMTK